MSQNQDDNEYKTMFSFNGFEAEIDSQDADQEELIEKAIDRFAENEKQAPKDGKASNIIRSECRMIRQLFDDLFGEGAGKKICGEKDNKRICEEAYFALLDILNSQKQAITNMSNRLSKYSNRYNNKQYHNKK